MSLLPIAFLALAAQETTTRAWTIQAERVYTGTGRNLEQGFVVVNGGKIAAVTPDVGGDGGRPRDQLRAYAVTAGLVDAGVRVTNWFSVEQSSEVTPHLRVADTLDPFALDWDRQVRNGVTTVLVSPVDRNVIGGLSVVLKTAGPDSIAERTVKADAVLRGSMGSDPSAGNRPASGRPATFYARRPTTRMGVEWEWRNAFFTAAENRASKDPGTSTLVAALQGKLPIFVQAWVTQDIRTAVFLREEVQARPEFAGMNTPRFVIDAAAEAWKEPQLLVRSKTPVVLPPFPAEGRTREGAQMAWNVAKVLEDAGVPFALSSHGSGEVDSRLAMQAGYAMSGGLGFDSALAAVTSTPAKLLGVDQRVGTIEVGKDADLVLWSGEPFQPGSRVVATIVDGVLRYEGWTAVQGAALTR
ncbi:MAG: amidohydrolase family protein [Planctomycetes bacterium]|nr:amidohydrolase family protein [Planctomycetota bacterium]